MFQGRQLLFSTPLTSGHISGTLSQDTAASENNPPHCSPLHTRLAFTSSSSAPPLLICELSEGLAGRTEEGWSGPVKVEGSTEARCVCVCRQQAERLPRCSPGALPLLTPRSASGCPRLGGHGLRLTETGRPGGLQPREDLLHPEETTSGDQDGYCVRVCAARLQPGR